MGLWVLLVIFAVEFLEFADGVDLEADGNVLLTRRNVQLAYAFLILSGAVLFIPDLVRRLRRR